MFLTLTLSDMLIFMTAMLAVINPPSILPAYAELVSPYSGKVQKKIAIRTGFFLVIIFLLMTWLGQIILNVLGISIGALQATGGIILLRGGLKMVDAQNRQLKEDEVEKAENDEWRTLSIVPIAIPLTVGGGTMALLVATASRHPTMLDHFALSGINICVALVVTLCYLFAAPISKWLGPTGMRVLVRVGGIVLVAISLQLLAKGLQALIPALSMALPFSGAN